MNAEDDFVGAASVVRQESSHVTDRARHPWRSLAATALLSVLMACGGGGGSDATPSVEGSPPPAVQEPPPEQEAPQEPPQEPAVPARLAALSIETAGQAAIVSRDDYLDGTYSLVDADGQTLAAGNLEIRGRGNSTWRYPKKPYRVRLADSTPLFGMPSSRHWVLLANYADKTMLRNDIVFEMSRRYGMAYTPRSQFVHVTLNGRYDGVYQLTESIRIATDRVNIPALEETDISSDVISGGYLLEVDETRGEDFCFDSKQTPMVFCAKDPEELLDAARKPQRDYIVNYMDAVDTAILGPDFKDPVKGYEAYIDVDSAITYFLIQEMVKNVDGNLRKSTYLYKKRDGKLFFDPLWDFDRAIGNTESPLAGNPEDWRVRLTPWFARLFEDPAFEARVKARWAQMKAGNEFDEIQAYIDERAVFMQDAQARNFQRWPILGTWLDTTRVVPGTYDGEISVMKEWLRARIAWMDSQLGN